MPERRSGLHVRRPPRDDQRMSHLPSIWTFYARELLALPRRLALMARAHWGLALFYGALFGCAAASRPFLDGRLNTVNLILFILLYIILAQGLNIVVGFVGLLDLGYSSFLAVGAVTASLLLVLQWAPLEDVEAAGGLDSLKNNFIVLKSDEGPDGGALTFPVGTSATFSGRHPFHFPGGYPAILLISGFVCALLGILRGLPTLRLTGDYFAIVTLGLAEILYLLMFNAQRLTGGAFGIKLRLGDRPPMFGEPLYWDSWTFFYLVLGIAAATVFTMHRLANSRLGRAWSAIRLDETAARTCGVNVSAYKLIAFAISGFIGGVAGGLYVVWAENVAVKSLDVWQSFLVLCCVVLGGMGSIPGVVLGAVALMGMGEALRYDLTIGGSVVGIPNEARFLIYGVLLLVLMRRRPQGLIPRSLRPVTLEGADDPVVRRRAEALFRLSATDEALGARR